MMIKGIRSFPPDAAAVIEFQKPLTLIVGANGAGKTVRESLDGGRGVQRMLPRTHRAAPRDTCRRRVRGEKTEDAGGKERDP